MGRHAGGDAAVFEMSERRATTGRDRAGTTLARLLIGDGQVYGGHIGDSRVCLVTERDTVLLTSITPSPIGESVSPSIHSRRSCSISARARPRS